MGVGSGRVVLRPRPGPAPTHTRADPPLLVRTVPVNRVMLTSDRVLKPVRKGWFEVQTLGLAGVGWARERRTDLIWGCCASWTPLCRGGAGRRCVPVGRSAGMGQRGQVGGSEVPGLLAPRSEQPGHSCSPPSGGLPKGSRLTSPRAPRSLGPSRGSAKPKKETRVQEFMPQSLRLLEPMGSLTR